MVVYETIFKRLVAIGIIDSEEGSPKFDEALKLKSGGFMDLNEDGRSTELQAGWRNTNKPACI